MHFGDSSGGALAIEAAAAGVAVAKLAVYEVPYTDGPNDAVADEIEAMVGSGRRGDAAARFFTLMGAPAGAIEAMKSGPHWEHLEALADSLAADVRLCNNGHVPVDRLAQIDSPVLALAGSASPWAPTVAEAVADAAPRGRAEVLEGQQHDVSDDAPAPVLDSFFA